MAEFRTLFTLVSLSAVISTVSSGKGGRNKQNSRNSWGLGESQAAPGQHLLDFAALRWSSVILNSLHLVWGLPSMTPVGGVGPGEDKKVPTPAEQPQALMEDAGSEGC